MVWWWFVVMASAAWGRPSKAEVCDSVSRAVGVLWTARSVAQSVEGAWPGWRPTLVGVDYHTAEGVRLRVGRSEEATCAGLPVPARVVGRRRAPKRPKVALVRERDAFRIEVVEGREGLHLEEVVAAVVHQLFHIHQYKHELDYRQMHPRGAAPDTAWAMRNVPSAEAEARQMVVLARDVIERGATPQSVQRLVTARRKHSHNLRAAHPTLPRTIRQQELHEGIAAYVELQVVTNPEARSLLMTLGVPERRLQPQDWLDDGLSVGADYPHALGLAAALVLDRSGVEWKSRLHEEGFDTLLDRAVMHTLNRARR
ncbi:MAG: hypothetical protein KTR31_32070 [Myxococcales bacterium]|nr:hypothetical protein [Myxococcales bacterium]